MINQVDWEAIGHACGNHKFIRRQWSSKVAANFLPTTTVMEDRGIISTPTCPCNCGATHKTTDHVLSCPKGDNTWPQLQKVLLEWGHCSKTQPGLTGAIIIGITQWREQSRTSKRTTADIIKPPTGLSDSLVLAFEEQTRIGWDSTLRGFLSQKWQDSQKAYLEATGSNDPAYDSSHHLYRNFGKYPGIRGTSKTSPSNRRIQNHT
eukprot:7240109-Ditylum_brightwellii.AAC.1